MHRIWRNALGLSNGWTSDQESPVVERQAGGTSLATGCSDRYEPTSGLDAAIAPDHKLLRRLKEEALSYVIISHDLGLVRRIADVLW